MHKGWKREFSYGKNTKPKRRKKIWDGEELIDLTKKPSYKVLKKAKFFCGGPSLLVVHDAANTKDLITEDKTHYEFDADASQWFETSDY